MKELKVLLLSSEVGVGAVGLSIARYVFAARHIEAIALPTVLFAARPDLGSLPPTRVEISAVLLEQQLELLHQGGWLNDLHGVMTGYFATKDQIEVVSRFLKTLKIERPHLKLLVDPVMGDFDSGLYVSAEVALALRADLLPLADVITPNLYEFTSLIGAENLERPKSLSGMEAMLREGCEMLAPSRVIVTSAIVKGHEDHDECMAHGDVQGEISTALIEPGGVRFYKAPLYEPMPKGTGDVFASELLALLVQGVQLGEATARTVPYLSFIAQKARGQLTIAPFHLLECHK